MGQDWLRRLLGLPWGFLERASLPWGTLWDDGFTRCVGPGMALQGCRGPQAHRPTFLAETLLHRVCCSSLALGEKSGPEGGKEITRWVQEVLCSVGVQLQWGHPPTRAYLAALGREGLVWEAPAWGSRAGSRSRADQGPSGTEPHPGPSCEGGAGSVPQGSSEQEWGGLGPQGSGAMPPVPGQSLQSCSNPKC